MSDRGAVPLIVMTQAQDHVEAINSTLRKAGHAVHCTWLPDARDLGDALTQLNPQMLLVFTDEPGIDLGGVMKVRMQSAPDVPVLIVRETLDEAAIAAAMGMGAEDAVTLANRERLQAVVTRELRAHRLGRDLSAAQSLERAHSEQLQNVLEASADAITNVQEGIVVGANRAWLELFGYSGEEALAGTPLMDLFELESHPALKGALVACLQGKWSDHALKARALLSDGSSLGLELLLAKADFEGEPATRITIPARHKKALDLELRLADSVKQDAATRFLQQRYLIAAIRERCTAGVKGGVRVLAFVKPDRFGDIQRSIGILASEDFVAQLAELIRGELMATDVCGRFGGNGFLILVERGTARDVATWAENLVKRVHEHRFTIAAKTLSATVTVGVGSLPGADPDMGSAVASLIDATRRGRAAGGDRMYAVDRSGTDARVKARDKIWVKRIKSALKDNRFRLVQQPIASLLGEDKGMFEVLVRMQDERGADVLPAEFMAAAERNDLMKHIDRWVIGAAMSFAANRKAQCIFVRVSQETLLDLSFMGWLETRLKSLEVEPQRLCIQVTEETANQNAQIVQFAAGLRQLGFRFALEHFGIGRDPERRLDEIGMDFIKVDGSLMQGLATNQLQQQRVKALVDAAKRKGVETVAERVEDANTMAVLWQLGVEFIQGYFVNAPEAITLSGTLAESLSGSLAGSLAGDDR